MSNCGWSGILKRSGRGPIWSAVPQTRLSLLHISKIICLIVVWRFGLQNIAITASCTLKRWSSRQYKLTDQNEKTKHGVGEFWSFRTCCSREFLYSGIRLCISSNWMSMFYARHYHHLKCLKYFGTFWPLKVRAVRCFETWELDCSLTQRRIPYGQNSNFCCNCLICWNYGCSLYFLT
jgi:hypothetical protein